VSALDEIADLKTRMGSSIIGQESVIERRDGDGECLRCVEA
jgi:hypothetical protein